MDLFRARLQQKCINNENMTFMTKSVQPLAKITYSTDKSTPIYSFFTEKLKPSIFCKSCWINS